MRERDISVVVGRQKKTAARFYCRSSGEVLRFLELLEKAASKEPPPPLKFKGDFWPDVVFNGEARSG